MKRRFESEQELVRAIGQLPRSRAPRRDLWPGIEQQLPERGAASAPRRPAFAPPLRAWAAALAVAFAAGILLGRQLATDGEPAPGAASGNPRLLAAMEASEREYQAAFRQFIPVGSASAMIGPQAVQKIEGSWLEMQQAETALLAALAEYPDNTYLNQRLLDLRARQLGFMQQLATLDQFSRRKT